MKRNDFDVLKFFLLIYDSGENMDFQVLHLGVLKLPSLTWSLVYSVSND